MKKKQSYIFALFSTKIYDKIYEFVNFQPHRLKSVDKKDDGVLGAENHGRWPVLNNQITS